MNLYDKDIKEIFINKIGGVHPSELQEVEFIQPPELKEIAKQLKIANKLKLAEIYINNGSWNEQFEILTKINEELYSNKANYPICNNLVDKDDMSTVSDIKKEIVFTICDECNKKYNFEIHVSLKNSQEVESNEK
jgi:uncharacterized protein with PIN domain